MNAWVPSALALALAASGACALEVDGTAEHELPRVDDADEDEDEDAPCVAPEQRGYRRERLHDARIDDAPLLGDFDGDGRADLAFLRGRAIRVRLSARPGQPARWMVTLDPCAPARCLHLRHAAFDMDHDGRLDLVSFGSDRAAQPPVEVLRGRGDGSFVHGASRSLAAPLRVLRVADVNRDGLGDLVVLSEGTPPSLSVVLGDPQGQLGPERIVLRDDSLQDTEDVLVADLSGDGAPELVRVGRTDTPPRVHDNDGAGRFGGARALRVQLALHGALADLDGDGHVDVLGSDRVAFGDGTGAFTSRRLTTRWFSASLGDLDGDGRLEVVQATGQDALRIGALDADRRLVLGPSLCAPSDAQRPPLLADLDGDGRSDLVYATRLTRTLTILRGGTH